MKQTTEQKKGKKSITIIELLVSMGIIAVLAGMMSLNVNPSEFLRQSRDAQRISDVKNLDINISRVKFSSKTFSLGQPNIIYLSLVDTSVTCSNLNLPEPPTGYSYHCVTASDLNNVDGTGWLPIDFSETGLLAGMAVLPTDPVNSADSGFYYLYSVDGESDYTVVASSLESDKYDIAGDKDQTSTDGGEDDYAYEKKESDFDGETDNNIVVNTNVNHLDNSYSPGWDTNLNGFQKPSYGFSWGYNGSVPNPSIGYHGHVSADCGVGHSGCVEFIDKNTQYGHPHRLQEIYQTWQNPGIVFGWRTGTVVRVKFMAQTDDKSKTPRFGLFHWSNNQGAYIFDTDIVSKTVPNKKKWEKITHEFTVTSDWETDAHDITLYLYGNDGEEGTLWLDNIQVEYLNP
ncbi:MAG: hypothetical protein UV58_C0002G0045 [Candidatus Wolfebacteria bacterium GW2011_GWC1_43_10]|uniref:Uncharacterized protein n=1 Tax=Candidatus Wolfebacteria bacterium GW2011_GWC1_43_10 TaxID=1619011 RepID=A0A0G1CBJ7_9BACT|nr:MAG: hypothetical protein UV58_C0002G0045 [Candidatus Wolfebacteria bacterium GW2011_GWC1_43_10]KKT23092.1 MAG: hypothetical protein UW08_C0001G0055 [Parcubacteria group bacterium GW2011_GWB1_43_8b]